MQAEAKKRPLTGRERIAKHRKRERERALQAALAAARIVVGQDPGDAGRALAALLRKAAATKNIPDDYAGLLVSAADALAARRRR